MFTSKNKELFLVCALTGIQNMIDSCGLSSAFGLDFCFLSMNILFIFWWLNKNLNEKEPLQT